MASVTLFVRNIPGDTTAKQLREFIEGGLAWQSQLLSWLRKHKIVGVRILALTDPSTQETEYHGLATIEPGDAADRIIKRLNLKQFRGKRVAVRRYYKRTQVSDRRRGESADAELLFRDRRKGDRRRRNLEDATVRMAGVDAFSRRLI
jgi:hypothetical protein